MNRLLLIAAVAALAPAAFAQGGAAPAAAPAAAAPAIPPPTCTQPTLVYDDKGKLKGVKELNKQIKVYQDCMNAYVDDQKQHIQALDAESAARVDAANSAIHAVKDFADKVNSANNAKPKDDSGQ